MCVRYRSEDRPSSLVRVWRDLFHRWPRREETAAEVISLEEKVAAQGVATAEMPEGTPSKAA